uniref:Cytochrome c oxidase subunit 3 n=1 Tax=Chanohirata hamata TaxID=3032134 RepID=A0A7G8JRY1_9HEMI|nr:cytochrome c oxidase subunit III [Chanohirata hamata]QNJ33329.1 cytochrome c oxidase subunit III [Chanohirata hamata]
MKNHPFHLVTYSPWPIVGSIGLMSMTSGTIMLIQFQESWLMNTGLLITLTNMFLWWRDVVRESTYQGMHTKVVIKSMKWGMILFITSEVLFFFSFFWAFFHSSLSPSIEIGMMWPPLGIKSFNPLNIPLLNTMILLSSGMSITWAHNALINNNFTQMIQGMIITVNLGMYFTMLQAIEYYEAPFSVSDSVYGATFYLSTGFHGLHVIVGTLFITTSMIRAKKLHFSINHHVGFEAAAWYWHFVDVVWLFLYLSVYWWGG